MRFSKPAYRGFVRPCICLHEENYFTMYHLRFDYVPCVNLNQFVWKPVVSFRPSKNLLLGLAVRCIVRRAELCATMSALAPPRLLHLATPSASQAVHSLAPVSFPAKTWRCRCICTPLIRGLVSLDQHSLLQICVYHF